MANKQKTPIEDKNRDVKRAIDFLEQPLDDEAVKKHFDQLIKQQQWKFEKGDGKALLYAVDLHLRTGRPVPAELATTFCNRLDRWFLDQVETLDEAFAVQRPKGQHFNERKERARLRPIITLHVLKAQQDHNLPIGNELFAIVAKELGLTERYVRARWYDKENRLRRVLLAMQKRQKRQGKPRIKVAVKRG
jgi:hypothetical protein